MIGIIYKFTIVTDNVKFKNNQPYYVGQHWHKKNKEHFLKNEFCKDYYIGGGSIWLKLISKLKRFNPYDWTKFIKREILFCSEAISQRGLDALEAYYIKREKAHYSLGLGGCNVLWGTSYTFDKGSPMNDENVRILAGEGVKRHWKNIHFH